MPGLRRGFLLRGGLGAGEGGGRQNCPRVPLIAPGCLLCGGFVRSAATPSPLRSRSDRCAQGVASSIPSLPGVDERGRTGGCHPVAGGRSPGRVVSNRFRWEADTADSSKSVHRSRPLPTRPSSGIRRAAGRGGCRRRDTDPRSIWPRKTGPPICGPKLAPASVTLAGFPSSAWKAASSARLCARPLRRKR
jgi:hypothetical protein